jgi:hypothetical protein
MMGASNGATTPHLRLVLTFDLVSYDIYAGFLRTHVVASLVQADGTLRPDVESFLIPSPPDSDWPKLNFFLLLVKYIREEGGKNGCPDGYTLERRQVGIRLAATVLRNEARNEITGVRFHVLT